jgi:PHD-finger
MANTCSACVMSDDSVSMDNLLSCQGCGKTFHNSCVDIDDIIYEALQRSKNLYWKCDECAGPKITGDPTEMIMKKLNAMSADIDALKLRQPPPKKLLSGLFTPRKTEAEVATPGFKRKRVETTTSTPALTHGTGATCQDLVAIKPLKWLYVSMLHPSTTEEAIVNKLSDALDALTVDFKCVKLLAKDIQSPTYISFKVGMNDDLFVKSLEPSIWPPGVAFREFVNRPRRNFRPRGVLL